MSETNSAFVTGATGFIGTHLCEQLCEQGWSVTALCRESSDKESAQDLDIEWVEGNILDNSTYSRAISKQDFVFHLAGVGLLDTDPDTVRTVNIDGTEAVLEACSQRDAERFIFTSTAGTRRVPDGETATEDDYAPPIGTYQRSKREAEKLIAQYSDEEVNTVTVHPTSVFGNGDTRFTTRLLDMVTSRAMIAHPPGGVSLVHIDDVVSGMLLAATEGKPGENYILGGENLPYSALLDDLSKFAGGSKPLFEISPFAVRSLGRIIGPVNKTLGTQIFPVNTEMARLVAMKHYYDSTKAKTELGYSYKPLKEFAPAVVEWYRSKR